MKNIRVFYRYLQKFFILISDLFYYKFCPERFSIIKSRYGSRYESWKKMILYPSDRTIKCQKNVL